MINLFDENMSPDIENLADKLAEEEAMEDEQSDLEWEREHSKNLYR